MDARIKVAVRCRPLVSNEPRSVTIPSHDTLHVGEKRFQFEHVFNEATNQQDIYNACVSNIVEGCFQGYNGTILAYGQTGSGKTHSIMGAHTDILADMEIDEEAGIIPRALQQVFHYLHVHQPHHVANVRVSMIEIYNDECKDLLHPEIPARDIMLREDKHGRIFFTGAREEVIQSVRDGLNCLNQGNLNRSTAETLMNQASSRSHAIFTISLEIIEIRTTTDGPKPDAPHEERAYIQSKLHLVDLAGSERVKKTKAVGTRFKESVGINQGLLCLGKVIRALTMVPISTHIPYRDSKLTRFLQDSLGGNSHTLLLACISPSTYNAHETINTLQYALRAKSVQNKVTANIQKMIMVEEEEVREDMESSLVMSLRAEIVKMQKQLDPSHAPPSALHVHASNTHGQLNYLVACLQKARSDILEASNITDMNIYDELSRIAGSIQDSLQKVSEGGELSAKDIRSSLRSSLRNSLKNLPSQGSAENKNDYYENKIQELQNELEECREDLQRDELIFATKMKEIKAFKKEVAELSRENKKLKEDLDGIQKVAQRRETSTRSGQERKSSDDLDISTAVAKAEPEVSQLMEDIETLEREKENMQHSFAQQVKKEVDLVEQRVREQCDLEVDGLVKGYEEVIERLKAQCEGLKGELERVKGGGGGRGSKEGGEYLQLQDQFDKLQDKYAQLEEQMSKGGATARNKAKTDETGDAEEEMAMKLLYNLTHHTPKGSEGGVGVEGNPLYTDLRTYLLDTLAPYVEVGVRQVEIHKLGKVLGVLRQERESVLKRKGVGKHSGGDVEDGIRQQLLDQLEEIQAKLKLLHSKASSLQQQAQQQSSPQHRGRIRGEYESIVEDIHAYEDNRQEIQERLALLQSDDNGAAAAEEDGDFEEELEQIDHEIQNITIQLQQQQQDVAAYTKQHNVASGKFSLDAIVKQLVTLLDTYYHQHYTSKQDSYNTQHQHLAKVKVYYVYIYLLMSELVSAKISLGSQTTVVSRLENQLSTKAEEYDGLVVRMQKHRQDTQRKQEAMRRETEEKLCFLLQQIKTLEQQNRSAGQNSSSSSTPLATARSGYGGGMGGLPPSSNRPSSRSQQRSPSPSMAERQSINNLLSDLSHSLHNQLVPQPHDTGASVLLGGNLNGEVVRRYAAERERREQLEKKNLEMAKELRLLREKFQMY